MDGVVDRGAGKAADLEQVSALGLEFRHLLDFLLAHVLEVDDDTVGAGLGDDAVERDDDDAGVTGLLDRAVQRVRRSGVDDDRVIALQDKVLDLRRLGRHFLVRCGEHVGRRNDLVGHRFLGDEVVALQHRLAPGIAGVIVGEGDFHLSLVSAEAGAAKSPAAAASASIETLRFMNRSSLGDVRVKRIRARSNILRLSLMARRAVKAAVAMRRELTCQRKAGQRNTGRCEDAGAESHASAPRTAREPYPISLTRPSRIVTRRSMRAAMSMLCVATRAARPLALTSCASVPNT